ncbi:MAG: hypothetical protein KGZ97_07815 [Bacteroidetes bacterium]|nr:hypothetical protein [Bacteroidota bacterium]
MLPIIKTTDKNGNKIAELKLYERYCGADEFMWGISWAKINEDFSIHLTDSLMTYERNVNGEIIEESRKLEVRHRHFFIENNGLIIEKKHPTTAV